MRHVRIVPPTQDRPEFQDERPKRRRFSWKMAAVRLLVIGWAGAIVAALIDEFGSIERLPFMLAMGMTGLLVAGSFILTREPVPEDERRRLGSDDDATPADDDLLTGLPTFAHFQRRLGDEFTRSRRMGRLISVVLVDVNNLAAVNKEYGVRAGDEVLRHVARAIDTTKRYNDIVARLGDDEFGVILQSTGEEGVKAFIERLEDRLARESATAEAAGRSISLWAGICSGSAVATQQLGTAELVLEAAMSDLNRAKSERERRRRMWMSA